MSLQVRPGYVNPLTMMKENKSAKGKTANVQDGKPDKLTELRTKQQSLQNEMLLLQSTGSDSSGNTSEKLEALKSKLEEVSTDLRTAKTDSSGSTEKALLSQLQKSERTSLQSKDKSSALNLKPDFDTYEKTEKESALSGIYSLKADQENSYKISFSPYSETE